MCLDINIGIHLNACKNEHVLEKDEYWNVCIQMVNSIMLGFVKKILYSNTKY